MMAWLTPMLRSKREPLHELCKCDAIHGNDPRALDNLPRPLQQAILTPWASVLSLSELPILRERAS
jgi:hypothetical protein